MSPVNRVKHLSAWLTGLGIVLLFLGYRGIRYIPMTEEEEHREEVLQQLMIPMSEEILKQVPNEDKALPQMLRAQFEQLSIRNQRTPPYWNLGVAATIVGGLSLLFGMGIWFRHSPQRGWTRDNEDV